MQALVTCCSTAKPAGGDIPAYGSTTAENNTDLCNCPQLKFTASDRHSVSNMRENRRDQQSHGVTCAAQGVRRL